MPEHHPLRRLFLGLTDRALTHTSLRDRDILNYLSNLLMSYMYVEDLCKLTDENGKRLEYLVDMLEHASQQGSVAEKKGSYQQIGDYSLFVLGMFPESLGQGRRALPPSYYAETGRHGYRVASELESALKTTVVFRKLAGKFERCVLSLNWIREYTPIPSISICCASSVLPS